MEKLKSQVIVTFWFWMRYPPPPPEIEIGLNMNSIEQNHFKRGQQVHFTIYPPPPFQYHYMILCLNRKLVNFNFKWIWIDGLEPHLPLLSSQKNEMLIFGLHSTSDDQPHWSMDLSPIHHPSPVKEMKCSFLDYVQLLMISPGWLMDSNPIHHPSPVKKMKCSFLDYVQLLMIGWAG